MKVGISRLAIVSLICATAFYVPLLTGVAAVLIGIVAVRQINRSEGALLGSGIAKASICVGAVHSVLWILLLFPGASFEVPIGKTGVVFRDEVPVRAEGYGAYRKWPLFERVELYPDGGTLQTFELEPNDVLLSTSKLVPVGLQGIWAICDPLKFAQHFGRYNSVEMAGELIEQRAWSATLISASMQADTQTLLMNGRGIEADLKKEFASQGICVKGLIVSPAN